MKRKLVNLLILSTTAWINLSVLAADDTSQQTTGQQSTKADQPSKEKVIVTSEDLERRGRDLRAEIESVYVILKESKSLKPMGQGRNFVTEMVLKYIPVGTSFDDAERILRSAGCEISKWPREVHSGGLTYKDDVLGTLPLSSTFPFGTKFSISLTPRSVGDYSAVDKVSAEIILTSV